MKRRTTIIGLGVAATVATAFTVIALVQLAPWTSEDTAEEGSETNPTPTTTTTAADPTDLQGLELPLTQEWEVVEQGDMPYSTVIKTSMCNAELESSGFCPGFIVVDPEVYNDQMPWTYSAIGDECLWYGLHDGQWHTPPQTTEEVMIDGQPATYRTHLQCDVDEGNSPISPLNPEEADVMHSWEVDGIIVVEYYPTSDDPLPGLEDLLAGASR